MGDGGEAIVYGTGNRHEPEKTGRSLKEINASTIQGIANAFL